jgi:two-component system sensor histidine kinase/response regulator
MISTLPPSPEAPLASMAADVIPGLQPAPQFRANILLVDDRRDKLLALEAVLEGLGQNIVKATSGKEALRCLLKQDFAVILLDVSMPGMDGFETASLIRSRLRSERTPIIFVTAFGDTRTHVARGYSLGAVDYLLSPIVPEVLCTKVSVFVELYKQTELIKRQAEELRRLNRVLENQVAALSAANSELEAFNYSIAHDLRAPLRSMGGFGKALLEDENGHLSPEGIEFATRIVRSTKYMDTLLQDLLAYSRLSRTEMPPGTVSVDKVVKETLALFEDAILDRHANVDVGSPLGTVQAHLPTVRQIMGNLLDNALKFCPPERSPVVRIYSASKPGILRLWVEDNGIGIPPEHHERIFGLFRQLHHDDANHGTGIGLAIVRRAAERMGGKAGVESQPGKGSRFWVDLPVSPPNVP